MFKKLIVSLFLSISLLDSAFSENASKSDYWAHDIYNSFSVDQTFKSVSLFAGDRYGDFKNDFVVTLSDGSAWKVHPNDKGAIGQWQLDDIIYVQARRSRYWFKREHNFQLYNLRLQESIVAMLVQYPQDPLSITEASLYVADEYESTINVENGKTFRTWDWILYDDYAKGSSWIWHFLFRTKIQLSDGTVWWVEKDRTDVFSAGNKVYIGANKREQDYFFFLITGSERESKWVSAILVETGL